MNDVPAHPTLRPALYRFMGIDLELAGSVLVPREETELLGHSAVTILSQRGPGQLVIDMCCGCGNLAVAVASVVQTAQIWACDLTDDTTAAARHNVRRLGLEDRVTVAQGDLFASLDADALAGQVDLVMCNPPYISTGRLARQNAHLLESEPREAFDGGPFGITIQQRLVREALPFLKPGGWLAFEFGEGQDRQASALLSRGGNYQPVDLVPDTGGVPRVALARKR